MDASAPEPSNREPLFSTDAPDTSPDSETDDDWRTQGPLGCCCPPLQLENGEWTPPPDAADVDPRSSDNTGGNRAGVEPIPKLIAGGTLDAQHHRLHLSHVQVIDLWDSNEEAILFEIRAAAKLELGHNLPPPTEPDKDWAAVVDATAPCLPSLFGELQQLSIASVERIHACFVGRELLVGMQVRCLDAAASFADISMLQSLAETVRGALLPVFCSLCEQWSPGLDKQDVQDVLSVAILEGPDLLARVELRALVQVSFPAHESLWTAPCTGSKPQTGLTMGARARIADLQSIADSSDDTDNEGNSGHVGLEPSLPTRA